MLDKLKNEIENFRTAVFEMEKYDAMLDAVKNKLEIYEPIQLDTDTLDTAFDRKEFYTYYQVTTKPNARSLRDHHDLYYHIRLLKQSLTQVQLKGGGYSNLVTYSNVTEIDLSRNTVPSDVLRRYLNRKLDLVAELESIGIRSAEVDRTIVHYLYPLAQYISVE